MIKHLLTVLSVRGALNRDKAASEVLRSPLIYDALFVIHEDASEVLRSPLINDALFVIWFLLFVIFMSLVVVGHFFHSQHCNSSQWVCRVYIFSLGQRVKTREEEQPNRS